MLQHVSDTLLDGHSKEAGLCRLIIAVQLRGFCITSGIENCLLQFGDASGGLGFFAYPQWACHPLGADQACWLCWQDVECFSSWEASDKCGWSRHLGCKRTPMDSS